jgi:arsenite-transporting ATPase
VAPSKRGCNTGLWHNMVRRHQIIMRIILFTGKGGVGKTSTAAATALRCAEMGQRTIVMSTDIAHSLADSFDLPLSAEPIQIAPNLWGQESDVYYNVKKYYGVIQSWMRSLFTWRGLDDVMAEELAVIPGMDELASLFWIAEHHDSGRYDTIIVDCAPTGETLRLLAVPESARWWLEKIFPVQRRIVQMTGPVVRRMTGMPVPDDAVFAAGEEMFRRLDRMHVLLSDPRLASVRLVVNAEKMVIKEAQRTYTYLNLYGYAVDMVVCNRMLPEAAGDGYFSTWREMQARHWQLIEEGFSPLPILRVPYFEQEVVGLEMLRRLGTSLYGDSNPSAIFYEGRPYEVRRYDGRYALDLSLPFVDKGEVSAKRLGDELLLEVGTYRRTLVLPRALADSTIARAHMQDSTLTIEFVGGSNVASTS